MATLFGHTQTLTSISKSVSAVAGGILGLQDNLANFMKKVIFYDKFFQRMGPSLPPDVVATAELLFARCYEYRDEIRDELESSLAYVADAGRWVIGMEDWNTKMDKRLQQINELVLLANALLMEYAISGKVGADGVKDELDAYLQIFSASVVLKHPDGKKAGVKVIDRPLRPATSTAAKVQNSAAMSGLESFMQEIGTAASKIIARPEDDASQGHSLFGETHNSTESNSAGGFSFRSSQPSTSGYPSESPHEIFGSSDDDERLNPFAHSYQPPYGSASVVSNASSRSGGVGSASGPPSTADGSVFATDMDGNSNGEPDSPVSLGEYECLDLDSIPNYMAFKSSTLKTRRQRGKTGFGSARGAEIGSSVASLASDASGSVASIASDVNARSSSRPEDLFPSLEFGLERASDPQFPPGGDRRVRRQPQQLMDLAYSYDLQRETEFNPFLVGESVSGHNGGTSIPGLATVSLGSSRDEYEESRAVLDRVVEDQDYLEQGGEDHETRSDGALGLQTDEYPVSNTSSQVRTATDVQADRDGTGEVRGDGTLDGDVGHSGPSTGTDSAQDAFHLFG